MFLSIDIGNTCATMALIGGEEIVAGWKLSSRAPRTEDELAVMIKGCFELRHLNPTDVEKVGIGSVVDHLTPLYEEAWFLLTGRRPLVVTGRTPMPVRNGYDNPDQVGVDRLANAVGGVTRYGAPLIVVDFGTALTFDVISPEAVYLGGVIVPGPQMMAESLSIKASRLPRIALAGWPPFVIGRNTGDSIASGVHYGLAGMVDELIDRIRREMGIADCPVVATGGDGENYMSLCRHIVRCDPWLTLLGLKDISEYQAK